MSDLTPDREAVMSRTRCNHEAQAAFGNAHIGVPSDPFSGRPCKIVAHDYTSGITGTTYHHPEQHGTFLYRQNAWNCYVERNDGRIVTASFGNIHFTDVPAPRRCPECGKMLQRR